MRHRGRGHDTDAHGVGARRGETGHHGGLEHLTTGPRVTADDRDRPVRPIVGGEDTGGRGRDSHGELRSEELAVGQAPDAVGSEESTHPGEDQRLLY
ncbi:hypothetical protein GCM10023403_37800 [Pseudonocardia benzenivorans]